MKTKLETLTINELYAYYKLCNIVTTYYGERTARTRDKERESRGLGPTPEYVEAEAACRKFSHRRDSLWLEIEKRLDYLEIDKELEDLEC